MQITSRFTIAVHIIAFVDYFGEELPVTSRMLSGSIHANPVIIRGIVSLLKEDGILISSQGVKGIRLGRKLSEITLFDVYQAVDCIDEEGMFHFHKDPNQECPVGRSIFRALNPHLEHVQRSMEAELKKVTMKTIADEIRKLVEEEAQGV